MNAALDANPHLDIGLIVIFIGVAVNIFFILSISFEELNCFYFKDKKASTGLPH